MSIYTKIDDIQYDLLQENLSKSNGFHGKYIKLEELILKIKPICRKYGIVFYFTSSETQLILKIIDTETGEQLSPAPRVRLPQLKDMKTEGGNYTYMKRYLLMNMFLVIAESLDPDDFEDEQSYVQNVTNSPTTSNNNEDIIQKTVKILESKGLNPEEITPRAIYNTINSNKETSDNTREKMLAWYKSLPAEDRKKQYVMGDS